MRISRRQFDVFFITALCIWLSVVGAIVYVAEHFISKHW